MKYLFTILLVSAVTFSGHAAIIYIKANATGLNNGTSWANAYTRPDSAFVNRLIDTIWIANGTYTTPNVSFWVVRNNMAKIFGGFAGTETALSQRTISGVSQTILDGHNNGAILACGSLVPSNDTGNAQLVIDGFQFINAGGTALSVQLRNSIDNATVSNNYFFNNYISSSSVGGGAMIIGNYGTVNINKCIFEYNGNTTFGYGGAICQGYGSIKLRIVNNPTTYINDCTFRNNKASKGGAISTIDTCTLVINRCLFTGNTAYSDGGALYDSAGASFRVYNSVIAGNWARRGAAHFAPDSANRYRPHSFVHCTIAHNYSADPVPYPNYAINLRKNDTLRNSILWADSTASIWGSPEIDTPSAGALYTNNIIKGGSTTTLPGTLFTYNANPAFVFPAPGAASAPFAYTSTYNYRLQAYSPGVDTGVNITLPAPFNLDADGKTRWQGPHPDLGAYEWKVCPSFTTSVSASGPLTFCQPGSVTLTATSTTPNGAVAYWWNGGTTPGTVFTTSASGNYTVVAADSNKCRASTTVAVNAVAPPSPAITISGNTLSVPAVYATYQWYKSGVLITGATSATYNPPTNGVYTVKVTTVAGGCPGTSAAYDLRNLGMSGNVAPAFYIYPNPVGDVLHIDGAGSGAAITLTDLAGRRMMSARATAEAVMLDVRSLAPGVYLLGVERPGGTRSYQRLVKK